MRQLFPRLIPIFTTADHFTLKQLFENKQLDVMLAAKEQMEDLSDARFRRLYCAPPFALLPAGHPLSDCGSVPFDALESERLIYLSSRCIPFSAFNLLQEKLAVYSRNHVAFPCDTGQAAALLVKSGYGVAILPEFYIPPTDGVVKIPLADIPSVEYGCIYRGKEKHVQYFVEHLTQ